MGRTRVSITIEQFPNASGLIARPANKTWSRAARFLLQEIETTWPIDTGTSLRAFDVVQDRSRKTGRYGWLQLRNKIRYTYAVEAGTGRRDGGGFIKRAIQKWKDSGRPTRGFRQSAREWRRASQKRRRIRIAAERRNPPPPKGATPLGAGTGRARTFR